MNDRVEKFYNPFYDSSTTGVLKVRSDPISLMLWREYFLKWTSLSQMGEDEDIFALPDPREDAMMKALMEKERNETDRPVRIDDTTKS
mmetsp:Transcript_36992/g.36592  ORF Transcript_36992/g.36592 Transcript_36992/m.36592 type:complete len:88 (+) Transcript_36992:164-427(+)